MNQRQKMIFSDTLTYLLENQLSFYLYLDSGHQIKIYKILEFNKSDCFLKVATGLPNKDSDLILKQFFSIDISNITTLIFS